LCYGGAEYNTSKFVGEIPCSVIATSLIGSNQEDCENYQVTFGFENCGCRTYPDSFCPMCEGAFIDIPDGDLTVPGTDDQCSERLFVRADENGSCDHAGKPAYFCGCPGSTAPLCHVCGDEKFEITKPNETLVVQGVGSATCEGYSIQALLGELDAEQCALMQAEASTGCGCVDPDEPAGPQTTEPIADDGSSSDAEDTAPTSAPTITDDSAATGKRSITVVAALSILGVSLTFFLA
jgi:hypothetical protein